MGCLLGCRWELRGLIFGLQTSERLMDVTKTSSTALELVLLVTVPDRRLPVRIRRTFSMALFLDRLTMLVNTNYRAPALLGIGSTKKSLTTTDDYALVDPELGTSVGFGLLASGHMRVLRVGDWYYPLPKYLGIRTNHLVDRLGLCSTNTSKTLPRDRRYTHFTTVYTVPEWLEEYEYHLGYVQDREGVLYFGNLIEPREFFTPTLDLGSVVRFINYRYLKSSTYFTSEHTTQ